MRVFVYLHVEKEVGIFFVVVFRMDIYEEHMFMPSPQVPF